MSFQTPKYWYGKMYYCCDCSNLTYYPADGFSKNEVAQHERIDVDEVCSDTGWWTRLSADGYLDTTEWSGPYDTADEARRHIFDTYEVDPEEGIDIDEWEKNEGKAYRFKKIVPGSDDHRQVNKGALSPAGQQAGPGYSGGRQEPCPHPQHYSSSRRPDNRPYHPRFGRGITSCPQRHVKQLNATAWFSGISATLR